MQETYYLNGNILPTIPVPHDCIIDNITMVNQCLVFTFEKDISYHDSIKYIKPEAKSLVIKFHLVDECFSLYEWHKGVKLFAKDGYFKSIVSSELLKMTTSQYRLEYLSHYVAYQQLIIEMSFSNIVRLELSVDRVEFNWIL